MLAVLEVDLFFKICLSEVIKILVEQEVIEHQKLIE